MLTKKELEEYIAQGLSDEEIGEKVSRHRSTIARWRFAHGLYRKKGFKENPCYPGDEEFGRLLSSGKAQWRIADMLGVTQPTISKWTEKFFKGGA